MCVVQHSDRKRGHSFVRGNKNTKIKNTCGAFWDISLLVILTVRSTSDQKSELEKSKN